MTSIRAIARELGVHPSTVMRRLDRGDDPRMAKHVSAGVSKPNSGRTKPIAPEDMAILERGLLDGCKPIEIAQELGVSRHAVYRLADKAGLAIRRGQINHIQHVRRAVEDMKQAEAVEYLLEVIEQMTGQDEPINRVVGGVKLTPQQALIFTMLKANLGEPVARERLLDVISFGMADAPDMRIIAVHVCRLRKLLQGQFVIHSVWGFGYRMVPA